MAESPHIGMSVGSYILESRVWEGVFGEVWKGKHHDNLSWAAAKFILITEYVRELRNYHPHLPSISAPPIVPLLSLETTSPYPYTLWEFCFGRSVQNLIQELGGLKVNITVYITRQILETLQVALEKGETHGALRPSRVIITPEKTIRLTDFGCARVEQRVIANLIGRGKSFSKAIPILPYFPPEVIEGKLFDDPRIDIYAVGILLAEMLTGKRVSPEGMDGAFQTTAIRRELALIMRKATAPLEHRYQHPAEMHADLTALLQPHRRPEILLVPPPGSKRKEGTFEMEAVPADSEEYRIAHAAQISAKQTIDEGVVDAVPAEWEEMEEGVWPEPQGARSQSKPFTPAPLAAPSHLLWEEETAETPQSPGGMTVVRWVLIYHLQGWLTLVGILLFLHIVLPPFSELSPTISTAESQELKSLPCWVVLPAYVISRSSPWLRHTLVLALFVGLLASWLLPFWDCTTRRPLCDRFVFTPICTAFGGFVLGLVFGGWAYTTGSSLWLGENLWLLGMVMGAAVGGIWTAGSQPQ